MMQQYMDAKKLCGDALLFFRMGDFYELFHEDAKICAEAIGLTLTSRDKNKDPVPMAGFPHHQLDGYLGKLIKLGYRVAICDQVEDPKKAKGLVRREVTRVVTPGTLTDDALLDPRQSNFLAAVCPLPAKKGRADRVAVAWVELSTGLFLATTIEPNRLGDELTRIAPAEILTPEDSQPLPEYVANATMVTRRPSWAFAEEASRRALNEHFQVTTLEGFGFDEATLPSLRAAGAILDYLQETQKSSLEHIERLTPYSSTETLEIDFATRRSLELTRTIRENSREGSLLAVLDRTVTAMGSRMLCDWLNAPLTSEFEINARLDAVAECLGDARLCSDLRAELRGVYDMQRLVARVTTGRASPRDLSFICQTLTRLPEIKTRLAKQTSGLLSQLEAALNPLPELRQQLEEALVDDCPISPREGGMIRSGYRADLDELRQLAAGGKQWIANYQAQESETAGIPSLKVGFNKVFGYYLEVTNAHKDKVPDNYIRKQTLKNAERYITPELKEYEEKVLAADDKAKDLEYEVFIQLRDAVQGSSRQLRRTADVLAKLDVLVALAELARQQRYCRPILSEENELEIVEGRHPVLDIIEPQGTFVPNDTKADRHDGHLLLITGPNMAGKSTYIRQVALITLMAQMGSFVPAKSARIGIADRIFARVGASDELTRGQSTFMVEMTETARILNTASQRSLVILDEIGRGTSTFDGLSLAWSIVEFIHDEIGCRTLFATHYHELTRLTESLDGLVNLNVDVKEWKDDVVFLHKIVPGAANKSYGIHVAKLAGVPAGVNQRAKEILATLEGSHSGDSEGGIRHESTQGLSDVPPRRASRPSGEYQLSLFGFEEHPLLDIIRQLDINSLAPLDALAQLKAWQDELQTPASTSKPR